MNLKVLVAVILIQAGVIVFLLNDRSGRGSAESGTIVSAVSNSTIASLKKTLLEKDKLHQSDDTASFNDTSDGQPIGDDESWSVPWKENMMFVKTHKCGTSTLVSVFYLYGIRRKLNFVLNPYAHSINLARDLTPPRPGGHYNILCQHGTFDPTRANTVLPRDTTLYVTILRSPVSHFVSAFNFFGEAKRMRKAYGDNLSLNELIQRYLSIQKDDQKPILNFSLNSAAKDLGFLGFDKKHATQSLQERIDSFIKYLDNELDFVMITDRLDESLVVLKEYLGWELTDLLYLNRMVSSKPREQLSPGTQEKVLEFQVIDRQLYDHFNRSFDKHVDRIGRGRVKQLLAEFQKMRQEFEDKCFDKTKQVFLGPYNSASWALSDYGKYVNEACSFLQEKDVGVSKALTDLQMSVDYARTDLCKVPSNCLMKPVIQKIQSEFLSANVSLSA